MKISLRTFFRESGWSAKLTGDPQKFPLEHRIFNGICILCIIIIGFNIPFNFFAGLRQTSLIFSLLLVIVCFSYYLSFVKKKLRTSINIVSSTALLVLAVNYFFSAGVTGASLLSLTFAFSLILIAAPRKQYLMWTSLFVTVGLGLMVVEFLRPDLIVVRYPDRITMLFDLAVSYALNIVIIFQGLYYMKTAYIADKVAVQEKKQALQILDKEKTKLFSVLSHDLHSPLASIQSYLSLLREGDLSPQEREMAERELDKTVTGTQELLYNLLSWSRSQLTNAAVNIQPVTLSTTVQHALESQRMLADNKKIQINDETANAPMPLADVNLLLFIIRNIVGNAIKFTPANGSVTISAREEMGRCQIIISDSGTGIPTEQMNQIFSLNVRSTFGTQNEKGIGLGLFLCKEYVLAQNGSIHFESTPGVGTKFIITLPLAGLGTDKTVFSTKPPHMEAS